MKKEKEKIEEQKISLEEAANLILSNLEPAVRDFAFEIADTVLKIPRWCLLLGSLLAQYESGTLVSPSIDPAWISEKAVRDTTRVCAHCYREFTPKRLNQKYCSNTCGVLAQQRSERKAVII